MQRFDKNQVTALLTEVVRKRGEDFIYGANEEKKYIACSYEKDGEPSCGIGLMLSDIGVTAPILNKLDNCGDSNINEPPVLNILEANGFTFTEGAVNFMLAFQRWQDQEYPYGKCLASAKAGHIDPFDANLGEPPF